MLPWKHPDLNTQLCRHAAHDRVRAGTPDDLVQREHIQGESGLQRLRQVIETYFWKGGFHLHINIVDAYPNGNMVPTEVKGDGQD